MILIADGGSTKTEWSLIDNDKTIKTLVTSGINPFYQETADIVSRIESELSAFIQPVPETIYFYGAGCSTLEKTNIVFNAIHQIFPSSNIFVGSDMLGAARSLCQNKPGIACILGTGSNSCYFDGKEILQHVSPLGYMLGDEGSGAALGKKLVSDILKHQLPPSIINMFFETYQISPDEILDTVYSDSFPNRYLAQYTKFLSQNIHVAEIESLVIKSFNEFIARNILQYPQAKMTEIHFTGSIAYFFKSQLIKSLHEYHLKEGRITMAPSADLIKYHLQNW
jgi:glucosamine kinase